MLGVIGTGNQPRKLSLPLPSRYDTILLPKGTNFSLYPGDSRSFVLIENGSYNGMWDFIGCFVSSNAPITIVVKFYVNPSYSEQYPLVTSNGMCFKPPSQNDLNPNDVIVMAGDGPAVNSPCAGNCMVTPGSVIFYNNSTQVTTISTTYTFFFQQVMFEAVPTEVQGP